MTLLDEVQNGENAALEFKEARPKDLLSPRKRLLHLRMKEGADHEEHREDCF